MDELHLIELAAKACGVHIERRGDVVSIAGDKGRAWDPLNCDNDAMELAEKLRIELVDQDWPTYVEVRTARGGVVRQFMLHEAPDVPKAYRRAIVRAAADIGKQM